SKKLKFSRETVRVLSDDDLHIIHGGTLSLSPASNAPHEPRKPLDPRELARNRDNAIRKFSWPHTFGANGLSDHDGAAWLKAHPNDAFNGNWKKNHPTG